MRSLKLHCTCINNCTNFTDDRFLQKQRLQNLLKFRYSFQYEIYERVYTFCIKFANYTPACITIILSIHSGFERICGRPN